MRLKDWMKENRYSGRQFCELLKKQDGEHVSNQMMYNYLNGHIPLPLLIATQIVDITKNKVTLKELAEMYTGGKA